MAYPVTPAAENRPKRTVFPSVAGCGRAVEGDCLHLLAVSRKACFNPQIPSIQLPEWLPEPEPVSTPRFSEPGVRPVADRATCPWLGRAPIPVTSELS